MQSPSAQSGDEPIEGASGEFLIPDSGFVCAAGSIRDGVVG